MPRYVLEDTAYGNIFGAVRTQQDGNQFVGVTHWIMPCFTTLGASPKVLQMNMRVPVDDTHTVHYRLRYDLNDPLSEKELWENKHGGFLFPEVIPGTFTPAANKSNDYLIDRLMQRNYSYTGIKSFPIQDLAMIEDQWGPIAKRSLEHLVNSDEAIIRVRRNILQAAKDLLQGTEPPLVQDVVDILRREVKALIDEGVSYIQLDSLRYVIQLADPHIRQRLLHAGQNLDKALDETIAADNATLQDARGAGVTVGPHMCRGNNRSAWRTAGGYEVIAEKAFNLLEVDRFLLEYDTERAGGFEPLRFVPRGKMVVLGLISSKDPQLESQDQLLRRIDEAAQYVPIENLRERSPHCSARLWVHRLKGQVQIHRYHDWASVGGWASK